MTRERRGRQRRQGGATRLELAVATILAAVLAGLLLDRLTAYQGEAERVAVKQLTSSLRTALAVRSAEVVARGEQGGLAALAGQNPMRWLQKTPENYLGEYVAAGTEGLPKAAWYFDRTGQALVYLPSADKSFSSEIQKVLIFKVKLLRVPDPVEASGRREVTAGLVLDQMEDRPLAFNTSLKH